MQKTQSKRLLCGRARRLATCTLACLILWPAVPPDARAQINGPYLISGTVTEAATGDSVVRARIRLLHTSDQSLLQDSIFTDETGAYQSSLGVGVGTDDPLPVSTAYGAEPVHPNPIGGTTGHITIRYTVPGDRPERPELELYDVLGRRVSPGEGLASGVYVYVLRFEKGQRTAARSLVLVEPAVLKIELVQRLGQRQGAGQHASKAGHGEMLEAILVVEKAGYVTHERAVTLLEGTDNRFDVAVETAPVPTASFTAGGTLQAGALASFDASASEGADGGEILAYAWDFGDGRRGGGARITHVYTEAGTYAVILTVTGQYGATASSTQTIVIEAPPPPASMHGSISGLVKGTDGLPLAGVSVHLIGGEANAQTGLLGRVVLEGLPAGVPITLELAKSGYATQRVVQTIPPADSLNLLSEGYFEATLLQRAPAVMLSHAELGGAVEGSAGTRVELPVEGLLQPDGSLATGPVEVRLTPVDIADSSQIRAFAGDFSGITPDGPAELILSYGSAEYVFEQAGQTLQLAPGKAAVIEIPIFVQKHPDGSAIREGDPGPLWSFDETIGRWVLEGTGTVVASAASPTGLALRAEVTHFSWWNFDGAPPPAEPQVVPRPFAVPRRGNPQWCDPENMRAFCESTFFEERRQQLCTRLQPGGFSHELFCKPDFDVEDCMEIFLPALLFDEECGSSAGKAARALRAARQDDGDFDEDGVPWDDEDWALFCEGNPYCGGEFNDFCRENPWFCPGVIVSAAPTLSAGARAVGPLAYRPYTYVSSSGRSLPVPPDVPLRYTATAANGLLQGQRTTTAAVGEQKTVVIPLFILSPAGGSELACNASYDAGIDPAGEVDTWTLTALAGDHAELTVGAPLGSSLQGSVTVTAPSGTVFRQRSFGPALTAPGFVEWPETGTYTVEVDGTANEPGAYSISLSCAQPIALDSEIEATLQAGFAHLYVFSDTAGEYLNLGYVASGHGGRNGISATVYTLDGRAVVNASASAAPYSESGVFVLPDDGAYLVRLRNTFDADTAYRLGLARISEPEPIIVTAPAVTISGELDVLGKHYFYRFDGTAQQALNLVLSHPDGSQLLGTARLLRPGPSVFYRRLFYGVSAATTATARLDDTIPSLLPEAGEYILEMSSSSSGNTRIQHTGAYEIRINTPEPQPLPIDSEAPGTLDERSFALYTFNATAGEHVNVAHLNEGLSAAGMLRATLYRPDGQIVTRSVFSNQYGETAIHTLELDGTYQIILEGSAATSGAYRLGLARIEEPEQPVPLPAPGTLLMDAISVVGDRRFYAFTGTGGQALNLVLSHPDGSQLVGRLDVFRGDTEPFYSFSGRLATASTARTVRSAQTGSFVLPESGIFLISIGSYMGGPATRTEATGAYEVDVQQ